jgi:hypothetical protein
MIAAENDMDRINQVLAGMPKKED